MRWYWNEWEDEHFGPLTPHPMLLPEVADILNTSVPLALFSRLGTGPADSPKPLRREFVLAAWIRAVLLEDEDLANRLSVEAAKVAPETAASMREFREAETRSRPLIVKLILLRFPGIGVEVRSGIGRNAAVDDIQLDGLNWWWWQDGYQVGFGRAKAVVVDWTTPVQRAQAKREWNRIMKLGEGHDWLYGGVLRECDRDFPQAPCAEALYRVGASYTAIGYWHDPVLLDAGLYNLDTRVPPILHRSFPRSVWARHIDADIETLTGAWRDPEGGYRNVLPYPR